MKNRENQLFWGGDDPNCFFRLFGIFLVDDRQTPPPKKKCPFSEIDFLDVSDDFKQKKKSFIKKNFGLRKLKKKRFFCYER